MHSFKNTVYCDCVLYIRSYRLDILWIFPFTIVLIFIILYRINCTLCKSNIYDFIMLYALNCLKIAAFIFLRYYVRHLHKYFDKNITLLNVRHYKITVIKLLIKLDIWGCGRVADTKGAGRVTVLMLRSITCKDHLR